MVKRNKNTKQTLSVVRWHISLFRRKKEKNIYIFRLTEKGGRDKVKVQTIRIPVSCEVNNLDNTAALSVEVSVKPSDLSECLALTGAFISFCLQRSVRPFYYGPQSSNPFNPAGEWVWEKGRCENGR